MPLVIVTAKRGLLRNGSRQSLGEHLANVVAGALSCDDEGGVLSSDDIEVRFQDVSPHTYNAKPFAIEIFANDYPSRRANLADRTARIANNVRNARSVPRSVVKGGGGFVWVLLGTGGFVEL